MWCQNHGGGGGVLRRTRSNHGGGGGVLRRTRSSHPWALSTRHPWRVTSGVTHRHRRLMSSVHRVSKRVARFARTDALRVVTWIGCRSAQHSRSILPSRRPSPNQVATSNACGWRMLGAPDRHAPWMARGERPGMARVCPAHRPSATRMPRECHPKSPREVPPLRATRRTRSNVIDSADTGH